MKLLTIKFIMKHIVLFLLFVFSNFNICYADYYSELEKIKFKYINNNGVDEIIIGSAGFSKNFKITEIFYENLKNHLQNFNNTSYYVYNSSLKEQNINDVKPCNLINFNQNYIDKIHFIRAEPIYDKNKDGRIISAIFGFKENYVMYKLENDKEIRFKIRDASEYCDKIKIENCNKDGKSGIECLKLLPEDCGFIVSSEYGSHCINLKTDEYELVEFGCDNKGCERMNIPVEYGN